MPSCMNQEDFSIFQVFADVSPGKSFGIQQTLDSQ
jgi:hypothetical protein